MHSERRHKICICSVILRELKSFKNFILDANYRFTKGGIFLFLSPSHFRIRKGTEDWNPAQGSLLIKNIFCATLLLDFAELERWSTSSPGGFSLVFEVGRFTSKGREKSPEDEVGTFVKKTETAKGFLRFVSLAFKQEMSVHSLD